MRVDIAEKWNAFEAKKVHKLQSSTVHLFLSIVNNVQKVFSFWTTGMILTLPIESLALVSSYTHFNKHIRVQ